jgi:hypothetical protein
VNIPRLASPATNPNGYIAAAGAVLAAAVMLDNAWHHHGVINTTVIVSAAGAVGALFARQAVTPVRDPKDGCGNPLVPAAPPGLAPVIPVGPVSRPPVVKP